MSDNANDHLKSLHTGAIDARNGYQEALEDAEGRGMAPLFREMISLHQGNANELSAALTKAGEKPDESGSFMSTVHKTIMSVRSLFGGLDESVLPGLIDGEKRNVAAYDKTLETKDLAMPARDLLVAQRGRIEKKIAQMESTAQPKAMV